jgi:hypothetical protein
MSHDPRVTNLPRMTLLGALTTLALSSGACVGQRPLDGQPACPCAPGWTCDPTVSVCLPSAGSGGRSGTPNGGAGGGQTGGSSGTTGGVGGTAEGGSAGVPTGGSAGGSAGTGGGIDDPTADPNCAASPASYHDYMTPADLQALLVRRWKRCVAPQINGEDVGVEFTADGHYYPLTRDGNGQVVRRTGIDYGGTWQFFAVGEKDPFFGNTLTRPTMLLNGTLTDAPKFTNDPEQMRITFTPVLSRYVPLAP